MSLQIRQRPLPYSTALTQRDLGDVDLAVIHCTELPELSDARTMGEKIRYAGSGTGNSGHFYIDRNGQVENWVPVERVAHHVRGFNERSIGIELVNRGRYPHWWHADHQQMTEHYTVEQMASLSVLLQDLAQNLPTLSWVTGHEDLDQEQIPAEDDPGRLVSRKTDPGPLFPWSDLLVQTSLKRLSS